MTAGPWLSIIGIGEDGLAGLSDPARKALADASLVIGGPATPDALDRLGRALREACSLM